MTHPPEFPSGPLEEAPWSESTRDQLIAELEIAPQQIRDAISELSDSQLNILYKNWSIRQIVHHLADSHIHVYIRFKWTLTEERPTIKAYEEADWVSLDDSKTGDIEPSLCLLDGLHMKWVQVLRTLTEDQFDRTFQHPQSGDTVSLWSALNYYPWHTRHHTGQILWLREQRGW